MLVDACTQTEWLTKNTTEPKESEEDPAAMQELRAEVGRYHAWLREQRRQGLWDPETEMAPCPLLTAKYWN